MSANKIYYVNWKISDINIRQKKIIKNKPYIPKTYKQKIMDRSRQKLKYVIYQIINKIQMLIIGSDKIQKRMKNK